jgi:sodium transport system permease protein
MMSRKAWRQAIVVFTKELVDAWRDKRGMTSVMLTVLIGPLITGFMMNRIADRQKAAEEIRLPIVGAQHAPALVEWLKQQSGVEIVPAPDSPERAVRDKDEYVVAIVPPDFSERFRSSRPATIKLVADSARADTAAQVSRVRRLFEQYNSQIGSLRLVGRGVSPAVASPVQLQDVEVSTTQQRAARLLSVIPLMILLAAFTGAMQIATDATAGERERGSLEALLINPVPRSALAVGKCLAAAGAAVVAVTITTGLCSALLRFIPLQEMGMRFRFGLPHLAGMLAAVLPMCLATSAMQSCVATMARSFKEAQSYMGILILAPMLAGMLGTLYPITNQPWMYAVPMLGQYVLLTNVLGGRYPGVIAFLTAAVSCLLVATFFVRLTVSLFKDERIVFGR